MLLSSTYFTYYSTHFLSEDSERTLILKGAGVAALFFVISFLVAGVNVGTE